MRRRNLQVRNVATATTRFVDATTSFLCSAHLVSITIDFQFIVQPCKRGSKHQKYGDNGRIIEMRDRLDCRLCTLAASRRTP